MEYLYTISAMIAGGFAGAIATRTIAKLDGLDELEDYYESVGVALVVFGVLAGGALYAASRDAFGGFYAPLTLLLVCPLVIIADIGVVLLFRMLNRLFSAVLVTASDKLVLLIKTLFCHRRKQK